MENTRLFYFTIKLNVCTYEVCMDPNMRCLENEF